MKTEDAENDFMESEEGLYSHDLDTKEIEQNQDNFTDLTLIRINFEPDELKIKTGLDTKSISQEKKIKDLFKNHV
jgi:hypothetical protein